ncbi:MAG: uracil-DNA glycosylase [Alphaproteobacteria bacterium]|nr:uracil-DNA glycosylase [Alphaproteobacteria bacterium]
MRVEPDPLTALRLQLEFGVDEAIVDAPIDRFAVAATPSPATVKNASSARRPAAPKAPGGESASAKSLADAAQDVPSLEAAIRGFEGCTLKRTATNTVFGDGDPMAGVMMIGEAPGADEDRLGKPFVGVSGQLLDRMLAAIGLDRTKVFITNMVYWRPPGNEKPSQLQIAQCLPFVLRLIALARPRLLVLVGGISAGTLLGREEGITRLRGRWYDFQPLDGGPPIPAMPTFHPAYLLRQPAQKRESWRDFLAIQDKLRQIG